MHNRLKKAVVFRIERMPDAWFAFRLFEKRSGI